MNSFRSILSAACMALILAAACASTASAAAGNSYTTLLPKITGESKLTATSCEALDNKTFAVLGQAGGTGWPNSKKFQRMAITVKSLTGGAKSWLPLKSARGEYLIASDFRNYDFAYVTTPVLDTRSTTFTVRKTNFEFGSNSKWHNPTIKLPKKRIKGFYTSVNVLNLKDGGAVVVIDRIDGQWIYRFTASGKPANFGTGGVVTIGAPGSTDWWLPTRAATPLLETYDGSIIVASSGRPGQAVASKALGLLKLDSSGKVVDGFADHGLWTPPASLADEKPLEAGEKRLTPIMMSVVGGTAAGKPLTALFGTQVEQSASTNVSIAAAQLTENGAQTFVTKSFDDASNGGDGGFPDAYPFDFAATDNGFRYANAVTQFANGTSARSYGKIAALTPSLAGPLSQKTFRIAGNFMAYDFAATPDDKYLYGCGSVSTGGINPGGGWKNYAPAIRRFKL